MVQNMSLKDFIFSHNSYVNSFFRYVRAYKNWPSIIINHVRKCYPITAIKKDGKKIIIKTPLELYTNSLGNLNFKINEKDKLITVFPKQFPNGLKFFTNLNFGGIFGYFIDDQYKSISFKNKTVIDVGAFIADSSIYFATKGAKKVIALEPLPQNFDLARKNICENNFSNIIELDLAACGSHDSTIYVNPNEKSSHQVNIKLFDSGVEIPVISLKKLVHQHKDNKLFLKLNCEGCEYDIILNSSNEVLQHFELLIIEYHYGYSNIKKKLEGAGFKLKIIPPNFCYNPAADNSKMYIGMIFAEKKA
jgi:FkbM family methyltransferase